LVAADYLDMADTMDDLAASELEAKSAAVIRPPNLRLHPSMADLYRRKVEQLETALNNPAIRSEASGVLRSMIERITLTPDERAPGAVRVEVQGDLAAILAAASGRARSIKQKDPVTGTGSVMLSGVAGHRTLLSLATVPGLFRALA